MAMSPRLLRPIASGVHPEAAAWRSAVVANGGSVSASTVKAVSTFCAAIDKAGIRDRFYRLNLFCGDSDASLVAVRTPLYRGPSVGGTQYGNALDTNNNFVQGDYSETGATGGLRGNTTNKYLDTGFAANSLTQAGRHLATQYVASQAPSGRFWFGTDNFGCGSNAYWAIGSSNTTTAQFRNGSTFTAATLSVTGNPHLLVTGNGSAESYLNGSASSTLSLSSFTAPATNVFVFALNRCGSAADHTVGTIQNYSIGDSMTAQQAADFYTALAAFNVAIGRT